MNTFIALLRGINVGGNNKLPMKQLKSMLENHGFLNVQTYIQSGNVVFDSTQSNFNLSELIEENFHFKPDVMILQPLQLFDSIRNCPFSTKEGKQLHYYFCESKPKPDIEKMNGIKKESESFAIVDRVFYLYAPEGMGRSKLAQRAEALLGVSCTARNLNTVLKLQEMIKLKN